MSSTVRHFIFSALILIAGAAPAAAGLCVDVDLHFAGGAADKETVETLEREAETIWAPYDVDLHWESPACATPDLSLDILVERTRPRTPFERAVLGSTHVQLTCTDRVPIVIDADATEATLQTITTDQLMATAGRSHLGPRELGRAFGRIVAHEIGHVILGLPNHQPRGLMRRAFLPIDMVRPLPTQYDLSPLELARLRHRFEAIVARRDLTASADPDDVTAGQCLHQRHTLDIP